MHCFTTGTLTWLKIFKSKQSSQKSSIEAFQPRTKSSRIWAYSHGLYPTLEYDLCFDSIVSKKDESDVRRHLEFGHRFE